MSKVDRSLLPDRVNEYLNYLLNIKAHSVLTVEQYALDLRLFFSYIQCTRNKQDLNKVDSDIDLSDLSDSFFSSVTMNEIYSFLTFCGSDRKNSQITRRRKTSSIRGFYKYISDQMGYIEKNPTAQISVSSDQKRLPKYLTLDQSKALLDAVDGPYKARDYCILTLFLNCGLRLAELCALNLSDIDFSNKTLLVTGKGNKQRMLYLNDACINALLEYLKVRPVDALRGDDRDALFISRLNKRSGRRSVQDMVYRYLDKIGLQGQHYSVHKLRHTAATLMYQHGNIDVLVIKDVLGHENLATTEIYTHIANKQIQEAIDKNPLNQPSKPADKKED